MSTPENPKDSEQNLTDAVSDKQQAMEQTSHDVENLTPPPGEAPAGNAKEQPQRRLG